MSSMYEITYNDHTLNNSGTPEKGRMKVHITDINAGNLATVATALATLLAAIQAIVIGELAHETIILSNTFSSAAPASSPLAQRENKWLVRYTDTTTHRIFKTEIPTADLSLLGSNSEFLDLSAGAGLAFKTAFEAVVKSIAGNAVAVVSVQFVGRSL